MKDADSPSEGPVEAAAPSGGHLFTEVRMFWGHYVLGEPAGHPLEGGDEKARSQQLGMERVLLRLL